MLRNVLSAFIKQEKAGLGISGRKGCRMKTNPYLTDFYKHYDEDSRLISKHGSVEFLTTMHYIEKYIKPCHRYWRLVPEPGRYSHALRVRDTR